MANALARARTKLLNLVSPAFSFHSKHYLRHTARRLEHLAGLRIPVYGTVLELGAGIGDHSSFYIDRGCKVCITDVRTANLRLLRQQFATQDVRFLDVENPESLGSFDFVHSYGILYHLADPKGALEFMASQTAGTLFLETCVSFGSDEALHLVSEEAADPTQAYSGKGCRPTRPWLFSTLSSLFEYVYVPLTQPAHEEFPTNWEDRTKHKAPLQRAVFVASRRPINSDMLTSELISKQKRCGSAD